MQEQAKNFEIGNPVLLNNVYLAHSSHLKILKLDEAFSKGDFKFIMEACRITLDSIFSNVVEGTQEGAAQECELRKPDLELRLQAENNKAIAEYRKAVEDYPKNVCCSCTKEKMSRWSSLTTTWEQQCGLC